jgi:flagellar biogenesis protein FliO
VGKKAVLIGVTDQQISMLTELNPDETTAMLAHAPKPKAVESFGQLFKKTTDKFRETQAKKEHVIVEA